MLQSLYTSAVGGALRGGADPERMTTEEAFLQLHLRAWSDYDDEMVMDVAPGVLATRVYVSAACSAKWEAVGTTGGAKALNPFIVFNGSRRVYCS
ncbi:unnamed protein product [Taenia asiatica]|uniref:Uncharacterized protein n=1 Tax=Taenia asiatica TaxID=60517 RepID=A0A0R3WB49_TAEAS|nr:unnamed protein product [Taenia asiatica]